MIDKALRLILIKQCSIAINRRYQQLSLTACVFVLFCIYLPDNAMSQTNVLTVGSFNSLKEGMAPPEWAVKEWKGKADAQVVKDDSSKALRLRSAKTSTALYKKMSFNIKDYPYLNWRWKVTKIPVGGDVRKKNTDDQAAQIYVIFPKFPSQINSRMLGYIWDTGAPAGSEVISAKLSTTRYIVLKSGAGELGKWFSEKRNVYEDYKRLFNEEPPKVGSVALMIDSDDTKTSAESFFGDIYFSRE